MGKSSKSGANEKHGTWRSISPLMVNLRAKVGASNVLVKAFKQKDRKREKSHICTDCLKNVGVNENSQQSYQPIIGISHHMKL